jgi:ABC-type multidrug transport system ATPase subunit
VTGATDHDPVLHADSIGKAFGGHRILSAATLIVRAGVVTALLGRMGAGKSTLLKICAGRLAPDTGWVRFAGRQHFRPRLPVLARDGLFYLPDQHTLLPTTRLRDQFALFARRYGRARWDEAVARLALAPLMDRAPVGMSGGERRRAELGLAVLRAPTCLLADEPFRGIDPIVADTIATTLRHLAVSGTAVVVTGHEIPSLLPLADEVVWCVAGTTHHLGHPVRAREHHAFRREYLGVVGTGVAGVPPRAFGREGV